jgi:metal-responsive CopG/Arc/MetJ family transcriptional regulator
MPKQKFYTNHISIRLMDHEMKKVNQLCLRKKMQRSVMVREIIISGINSALTKKNKQDE